MIGSSKKTGGSYNKSVFICFYGNNLYIFTDYLTSIQFSGGLFMVWLIIVIVVIFVIYLVTKDHNEVIKTNVTNYGGMKEKYKILVEYLTQHPSSRISQITKDSIIISSSTYTFTIDYMGNGTEINLTGFIPLIGRFSKRWKYPEGYPQEKVIEEIENYLEWKMNEFKKIAESNPSQYIDYKK